MSHSPAAKTYDRGGRIHAEVHRIGGRREDGSGCAIGPWTFETPQVREVVEDLLEGEVLNACAGKTKLNHHEPIHRNDVDENRDADTHIDVCTLDERLDERFDTVVYDPPFDKDQADEHYNGHHIGRGPSGEVWSAKRSVAQLTRPGGIAISVGWNSIGLEPMDGWTKEEIHIFQRGSQLSDVLLSVDRNMQQKLGGQA